MSSNDSYFTTFDYGNVSQSASESRIDYHLPAWYYFLVTIFPIVVFSSIFSNVLGLVITVRGRMWRGHEGYVYLTAIFSANIAILIFEPGVYWIRLVGVSSPIYYNVTIDCILQAFKTVIYSCGWLSVALMFNVYLRDRKTQIGRCGCSPSFATKYCTLRATKIIVGIISGSILGYGLLYLVILLIGQERSHIFGLLPVNILRIREMTGNFFTLLEFFLMWIIPFIFFLPVVLLLAVCRSRPTEGRTVDDDQFRKAALILSSMTFCIQLMIVVSDTVVQFLGHFHRNYAIKSALRSNYEFFMVAFQLVLSLSLAVQPVICILVIKQFKDGFYSVMPCCKRNSKDYTVSRQDYGQEIQLTDSA